MKISTKGRYALRLLLELAQQDEGSYIPLQDMSNKLGVSKKYLEQIVSLLRKSDLLEATRGNNGGYRLKKKASDISLLHILKQTENELHLISCHSPNNCSQSADCLARILWLDLDKKILDYCTNTSLQDILDRK